MITTNEEKKHYFARKGQVPSADETGALSKQKLFALLCVDQALPFD